MSDTAPGSRNLTIDAFRVIGAIGIIVFHMHGPMGWLGYAALPFFIALSVALTTRPDRAGGRAVKLVTLWLAWCAIFAALKGAQAIVTGKPLMSEFAPWMIWTGPGIHLWFLPYIAAAIWLVGHVTGRIAPRPMAALALGTLAVVLVLRSLTTPPDGPPLAQWSFGLPAVLAGLAILAGQRGAGLWPGLGAIGMLAAAWLLGDMQGGVQSTIGCAVVLIALTATGSWAQSAAIGVVARLAPLSLGAYLVHPAVVAVIGQLRTGFEAPHSALSTLVVVVISFFVAWLGARLRVTRPLFVL